MHRLLVFSHGDYIATLIGNLLACSAMDAFTSQTR